MTAVSAETEDGRLITLLIIIGSSRTPSSENGRMAILLVWNHSLTSRPLDQCHSPREHTAKTETDTRNLNLENASVYQ